MGRVQKARYGHPSPVAGVRLAPARPVYEATKRGFDIAFALLLGAVLTPVWLPAAVLEIPDDGGRRRQDAGRPAPAE